MFVRLWVSFFMKFLLSLLPVSLLYYLIFFSLLICRNSLFILDKSPLLYMCIIDIIFCSIACLFTLLTMSSDKLLILK